MKIYERTEMERPARMLLVVTVALLLVVGLSLLLSHFQVLAQPEAGNLVASKSVDPSRARPGESLTYTVYITNTGGEPVWTAWMTDSLPPEVNYSGGLAATMGTLGRFGDVITWTGLLTPDDVVAITFVAQITDTLNEDASFSFVNTATITGAGSFVTPSVEATAIVTFETWLPLIFYKYPPIPELYSIPTPGDNNSYRVSWESIVTDPSHDGYVLQEATNADFTVNVQEWLLSNAYRDFEKGLVAGTFYYRVRVDDADRWGEGPWSNVESVSIGFYDDFSNSSSGWPQRSVLVIPETDTHYRLRYEYGHYRIMIDPGGPPIWFHQPDAFAPYRPPNDKYCVETKIRFVKNQPPYDNSAWDYYPYWANAGLVFGANEANTNLYAVCLSVGGGGNLGWFIVNNPTYAYPYKGCNYMDGVVGGEGAGSLATEVWHRFQVSVDGNWASVYIDGTYKGAWNMYGLGGTTRVGLVGGDYEVAPVDIRFDNFRVVPNVACAP
ncbi:MAG: DUF11 domain-containing protein [Chloroflexi bacterium]|nr:DUF11 domain-containing protein [Chloroflexota bacterium]